MCAHVKYLVDFSEIYPVFCLAQLPIWARVRVCVQIKMALSVTSGSFSDRSDEELEEQEYICGRRGRNCTFHKSRDPYRGKTVSRSARRCGKEY